MTYVIGLPNQETGQSMLRGQNLQLSVFVIKILFPSQADDTVSALLGHALPYTGKMNIGWRIGKRP
ncbi:MAG: hypothetical protein QNI89_08660 [Desulfobacterales bacterium]|nr:hypothetical protein [Desulfobacterales bacterium]MDJ0855789.1 hypothetical protein [Desulfobacterales bacterium]MDJ0887357.1 hypothetical protein [Desulfobacterales bacterium]